MRTNMDHALALSMIAEYRIISILIGITYLAEDSNLERRVAIKEYLPSQFKHRPRSRP